MYKKYPKVVIKYAEKPPGSIYQAAFKYVLVGLLFFYNNRPGHG
jgi:hypothetical protein